MFWQQEESMLSYVPLPPAAALAERHWKPKVEVAPNCPRCHSSNTKFCYYNNYSHSQPRYFCKGCRRYWTKGGSLRNVPVGGGCRKNRRGKSSKASNDQSGATDPGRPRPPVAGSIRPDLALEDMVSNSREIQDVNSPAVAEGSAIDMAVLYAKFLNQCPEPRRPESFMPELAGEIDHDQSKEEDWQRLARIAEEVIPENTNQADVEGLDQYMGRNVNDFESIEIPMDYNFFDSECLNIPHLMSEELLFQDFGPLATLHQPHLDSEWSKLGYSSTENFYRY